eukprot:10099332-Alexandrium_andersonii.AAC.1
MLVRTQPLDTAKSPTGRGTQPITALSLVAAFSHAYPCEQAANSPDTVNSPDTPNTGHTEQPDTLNTAHE